MRNTSYRDSIAEKINPYSFIKKETYTSWNKERKWTYGFHKEFDENFICISKDGTLGEVYKVGDLIIGLPSQKDKEIINADLSPEESIWRRTEIPEEFLELEENYRSNLVDSGSQNETKKIRNTYRESRRLLLKKYKDFIAKEYERRKNGLFIKIDEEVFYMTGSNYMFLNYYYLTDSDMYPLFRTTAVHTWWHWEAVKADDRVFGELRFKSRRVAWTSEAASEALNAMTITRYGNIPVVSERRELAWELFQSKIVDPFKYYPTYFKPVINDPNDLPKTKIEITHDTPKRETSRINTYPTKLTAYDSTRVTPFSINDEVFKFEDVNFSDFRARHKRCYNKSKDTKPKGKFGSTTGDKKLNIDSARHEWENSSPLKRDKTGTTGTGLVALFVDACYTWGEEAMFDKWGYPIVHDPVEPIENEIGGIVEFGAITKWNVEEENAKKMKKSELNSFYRNVPRTIEHALRHEGGINNDFDIDNLNNHYEFLDRLSEIEITERIFRGNLNWMGDPFDSKVRWDPNPKGRFQTTWIPNTDLQNQFSKKNFHGSMINMPDNSDLGCFGVDSYDIIGNAASGGSDGAIVGYSKFNMAGAPSNSFFLVYKERPEKRDDFFEDVIKTARFFGMFALVESNKSRLLEFMYDNGHTGWSLRRQDKKWKDLTDAEKLWGGIPSSTEVIEDQTSGLKDYIVDYVGIDLENDCKVWFKELIKEWIMLKPDKRKEFDLGVASGLAKMGAQYKVRQRKTVEGFNNNSGLSFSMLSA